MAEKTPPPQDAPPQKRKVPLFKSRAVQIACACVLVAAVGVAAYLLTGGERDTDPDGPGDPQIEEPGNGLTINAENVKDIERELGEKIAKGMFATYMNMTWRFPDGNSPSSNAVMGNSGSNNYDFYFTVALSSTSETIFTSGLIPVGKEIAEIVLDVNLSAGTYPAVVIVHMIDENGEPIESNASFNITLIIES